MTPSWIIQQMALVITNHPFRMGSELIPTLRIETGQGPGCEQPGVADFGDTSGCEVYPGTILSHGDAAVQGLVITLLIKTDVSGLQKRTKQLTCSTTTSHEEIFWDVSGARPKIHDLTMDWMMLKL